MSDQYVAFFAQSVLKLRHIALSSLSVATHKAAKTTQKTMKATTAVKTTQKTMKATTAGKTTQKTMKATAAEADKTNQKAMKAKTMKATKNAVKTKHAMREDREVVTMKAVRNMETMNTIDVGKSPKIQKAIKDVVEALRDIPDMTPSEFGYFRLQLRHAPEYIRLQSFGLQ